MFLYSNTNDLKDIKLTEQLAGFTVCALCSMYLLLDKQEIREQNKKRL